MRKKKGRGFASMSPARVKEIARMGGLAVYEAGTGYRWTKESASAAGKKTSAVLVKKYGPDYFKKLGARGGAAYALKQKKEQGNGSNS